MPSWLPWLLLHALLAVVVTAWARRYALQRQLLDQPGERRSHVIATPRGGGISIVVALLFASAWVWWHFPDFRYALSGFAVGLCLVAGVGWWDDHRALSPLFRLSVHVFAAALLGAGLWVDGAGPWVVLMASVLALGLTNVWNFMDGINGLAASQAALLAAALAWILPAPWNWISAALLAGACGFLPFNFPAARIFLGDVGSGALGFALGALLGVGVNTQPSIDWLVILMLPVVFMVDAGFTLLWRMLRGERWWTPHVQHAYQRWARRLGHMRVTVAYSVFTGLAVLCSLYFHQTGGKLVIIPFGICYTLALALWLHTRKFAN